MAAAIPVVLKVVGIAMSVKSLYDGIKEGNFLQAVMGAVGAYYGVTSFGSATGQAAAGQGAAQSTAAGAANEALVAGADQATKSVINVAGGGAAGAAGAAGVGGIGGAGSLAGDIASNVISGAGGASGSLAQGVAQNVAAASAPGFSGAGMLSSLGDASSSVLSDATTKFTSGLSGLGDTVGGALKGAGTWAKANPELASAGLQVGGGMLAGYSAQKQQEELLRQRRKELEESRNRRGAVPDNFVTDYYARTRGVTQ